MNQALRPERPMLFVPVGKQPARLYGLAAEVRAYRVAANMGLAPGQQDHLGDEGERGTILSDLDFAWDPAWLQEMKGRPNSLLLMDGRPVLGHCTNAIDRAKVLEVMRQGARWSDSGMEIIDPDNAEVTYHALRKRDRPFVMPLSVDNARDVERALYDASYKGVTDLLTLYLWRRPAFHLTRWAAQLGMAPNMVTAIGAILCVAAFFLFLQGQYWAGIATGLGFMVLDTVDGKLARCTGTSSKWGNLFDHGIDLIHPPFWWWAWAEGLKSYAGGSFRLEPVYETMVIGAIVGGYIVQRVIEGIFVRRYFMHIHVWQQVDSRFRLITARRNPNMVILFGSLLFGRPDIGLQLVALWTILSLIFHAVRITQANGRNARGEPVTSWLA